MNRLRELVQNNTLLIPDETRSLGKANFFFKFIFSKPPKISPDYFNVMKVI